MDDAPFTHIVRVDIDPEHEDAFAEWYVSQHFPDLLACPGWLSAQRYITVGEGQKYAAVYEVAGKWAFDTPEFHKVKGFGPFTPHVRNFARVQIRAITEKF
ncbi:hypothetical protein [Thioclava sp. GXIMD2076]|uniref:DUF4286 family protein n=1 Tax=Thioclava kandeliae TaxID=3070818 RepID=A0ABV1SHM0_9RHOB